MSSDELTGWLLSFGFLFLLIFIPYKLIMHFGIGYDPEIAIDNYSPVPVSIYLDDEFWLDVPISTDLKTNSLDNEMYSIDEGSHIIKIKNNSTILQEYEINVEKRHSYVLNVLNACGYNSGRADYRSWPSSGGMSSAGTYESFIEVGDYDHCTISMFSKPVEKLRVRKGTTVTKCYIYRARIFDYN